jgi:transcriptional regulator with XRE-family HTH domain
MLNDLSLKSMAEGMGMSSAHLSGIEYGEKRLSDKHIAAALAFFSDKATPAQLRDLRDAAEQSKAIVSTVGLASDARGLVAAFARRLSDGATPPPDLLEWITRRSKED